MFKMKSSQDMSTDAQYYLGIVYYYGEGVTADPREAIKFFRKAAEQGHVHAMVNLGMMLWETNEVGGGDSSGAASWFSRAASHGDPNAQWMLGKMHYEGLLASKPDMREAFRVMPSSFKLDRHVCIVDSLLLYPSVVSSSSNFQQTKVIRMDSSMWVRIGSFLG
jgi:Sel1 repeat